ncbi:MAG: type secretion system protein TrbL [Aliidongia sp.]|nr:type secretion system protein TrbL [Aliidongia sp.]
MNGVAIIDQFLNVFTTYIDSGFGLLKPEIAFLSATLIVIDMTLAGLFWALGGEEVLIRLVKKTLYIGFFAFLITNWKMLTGVVFNSFAGLGLQGAGASVSLQNFLQPGRLAQVGVQAGWPILHAAGNLIGFSSFLPNFIQIFVLLLAWLILVASFFVLAVQLFVTLIEFKLTTLAGFVLVPFGLWGKSAFLAERVLGFVITCGIKVLVLAVIVGIGSTLFGQITAALPSGAQQPTIADALDIILGSIAMLGLGIFGPAIASGLVSGAPQLGAGAALGTAGALIGGAALAGGAAGAALGLGRAGFAAGMSALRAGTSLASATTSSYGLGAATSGKTGVGGVAAGIGGIGRAGAGAAGNAARSVGNRIAGAVSQDVAAGRTTAWRATGGGNAAAPVASSSPVTARGGDSAPDWARRLRAEQARRAHLHSTAQAVKDGDRPTGEAHPDLEEKDE